MIKAIILGVVILVIGIGVFMFSADSNQNKSPNPTATANNIPTPTPTSTPEPTLTTTPTPTSTTTPTNSPIPMSTATPTPEQRGGTDAEFAVFSKQRFEELSNYLNKPGLTPIGSAPHITGHEDADGRIISIARSRGYQLQGTPTGNLVRVSQESMQPLAADSFSRMRKAALTAGYSLDIVSGYRSVDYQRELFLNRFREHSREVAGRLYTKEEIANSSGDEAIQRTLRTSAPPGFSKHHTGYSIDLGDRNSPLPYTSFGKTNAFVWISSNNYLNAKRFGFVPSYPKGVGDIGPMPEPWEYVWVGVEMLKN